MIVPREHALGETSAPVRLAQLRDVPLVSPPRDSQTRLQIEGAAAAAGLHLRHAVLVPGFPEIIEYVRAGVGIGFVPAGALPKALPDEVVARLLSAPALSIVISIIRLVGRHMSPAADAFWGLVLKHLRSEPRASAARPQKSVRRSVTKSHATSRTASIAATSHHRVSRRRLDEGILACNATNDLVLDIQSHPMPNVAK